MVSRGRQGGMTLLVGLMLLLLLTVLTAAFAWSQIEFTEAGATGGEAGATCQRVTTRMQRVSRTDCTQFTHQRWQIRVLRRVQFAIDHRLVETRAYQCIPKRGDVAERADMQLVVCLGERFTKFP